MKKLSLLIAALLLVSFTAFAVEVAPSATVTGEAKVSFGFDLETNNLNIVNSTKSTLSVTLVAKQSVEKGEGEVVGWIELSGIELVMKADGVIELPADATTDEDQEDPFNVVTPFVTAPSVKARIFLMGPALYLDIVKGSVETDFAKAPEFDVLEDLETVSGVSFDPENTGTIGVVYTADAFNFSVYLADADADAGNDVSVGAKVGVTAVENLTFTAGVSYGQEAVGYGVSLGYDLGIANIAVAYDGIEGANEIAASLGVDLGATVKVTFGTDLTNHDLIVALDTADLIPVVKLGAAVELANLETFGLKVTASATLDPASPYAEYTYTEAVQTLKVGTGLAVIENVALDLNWETEDLGNSNGALTFSATIKY